MWQIQRLPRIQVQPSKQCDKRTLCASRFDAIGSTQYQHYIILDKNFDLNLIIRKQIRQIQIVRSSPRLQTCSLQKCQYHENQNK